LSLVKVLAPIPTNNPKLSKPQGILLVQPHAYAMSRHRNDETKHTGINASLTLETN